MTFSIVNIIIYYKITIYNDDVAKIHLAVINNNTPARLFYHTINFIPSYKLNKVHNFVDAHCILFCS